MFKFFKDLRTFFSYKKVLKNHEEELFKKFKVKIDFIGRMYTIFSIPPEEYKTYGDELMNSEVKKYLSSLDKYLIKIGLADQYGLDTQDRLDELNYKIIIRFKPINTLVWANILMAFGLTALFGLIVGASIFLAL